MRKYELVLILKPDLEDEVRNEVFNRVTDVIKENGQITDISEWGQRKLAYEINYIKEGYYYIVNFESDPKIVDEIERRARISDYVLRYLVSRIEK